MALLQFKITYFYSNICSNVPKLYFSIITPVVSVTQSSEIIIIYWFTAQETFLIIINVENSCAAFSFSGTVIDFYFRVIWWIESSKEQHFFKIERVFGIIHIFTVAFDQFMHIQ